MNIHGLTQQFRASGADLPGGDPRPSHGAEMEGYFWRITHAATGRVVVALCGINRHPDGDWATVAMASHPEEWVARAAVGAAAASPNELRVTAGNALQATDRSLDVDLGPDMQLHVKFEHVMGWPLRLGGGGIFSAVPFLNQYWHPHMLGGLVSGSVTIGGTRTDLEGATVYAEKNWGRGFPLSWWWGQAHGFSRPDLCVAFTGGILSLGPVAAAVGGAVVRMEDRVLRFAPPFASVHSEADGERWQVRARRGRTSVTIDARVHSGAHPALLPVPDPASRRQAVTDIEHLVAHLDLTVMSGRRVVLRDSTELAGLELGYRPDEQALGGWGAQTAVTVPERTGRRSDSPTEDRRG